MECKNRRAGAGYIHPIHLSIHLSILACIRLKIGHPPFIYDLSPFNGWPCTADLARRLVITRIMLPERDPHTLHPDWINDEL